jgi:hypothetical protein
MAKVSKAQRQNIFRLIIVASLILGGYSINTLLVNYVFFRNSEKYPISEEGNNISQKDVIRYEIEYNYQSYLDALFNSSFFENLTLPEQMDFLENLLGNESLEYLEDSGLTPEEFLTDYGDELEGLFDSLGGGDSFDSSMLDEFPPELAAALLARPMFYTYHTNPSNPWNNPSDTLFKIGAYDYYNTTSFDWEISGTLDNSQSLGLQTADEEKFKIKFPIMASPQVSTGLPAISPSARVLEYTPSSDPLVAASVDLKNQIYLGGMVAEASFSEADSGDFTNLTYNLLYDSNDYESAAYYETYGITMAEYTSGNIGITECMKGPDGVTNWDNYRSTHPFFDAAATELENSNAFFYATNLYDKAQAVIDYVGANFVYNVQGNSRPAEGEDPLEWLSEVRESKYPFEITSLTVALARLEGLSVRYVSGYKWDNFIAAQFGGSYYDAYENEDAYPYLIANSYTWLEVFIPLSSSTGDWVELDNNFSATPTEPTSDDLSYILTFDGSYIPEIAGYDRGTIAIPTEIEIEVTTSFLGNPLSSMEVVMKDISYDTIIDSTYTASNGIATFTLSLLNMVSGPHVLNFSSEYMGVQFGNVSIVNVVEDLDVYLTSATPTTVNSSFDPEAMLLIEGYVWDPEVDAPIKNAQILAKGVEQGKSYPGDLIDFIPSVANVSDINGNFTFNVTMLGWQQANYSIYTLFTGVFNISNDISQFSPVYQPFLSLFEILTTHLAYPNADNYNYVNFLDADYIEYTFTLNNTSAVNGNPTTYPTGPTIGYRNNLTLGFTALTYWGTDWASGNISVDDETEGRNLDSFITNSGDGQGSITYDVSSDPASDWTIGPHLIKIEWVNASHSAIGRFWVFIKGNVTVDQTSDDYPDGRGGPTGGKYFINSGASTAYADEFNITGNLRDADTSEALQYYRINYRMFDNTWTVINPFFIELDALNEVIPGIGGYTADFRFSGATNVNIGPVHTDSYFTGEWDITTNGWNNSWNTYWSAYYTSNFANDSSSGSFELSDPTDFSFTAHLDNIRFANAGIPQNRLKGTGTTIQISFELLHESVGYSGIQVYLQDITNGTTFSPISTDISGNSNFTFSFTLSEALGIHNYRIYLDTGVGLYEDFIEVIYDPNSNYDFEGRYNQILFDSASPNDLGVGESFDLSGEFLNNSIAQSGATVDLIDNGVVIDTKITNTNGWVNFTVIFGSGFEAGSHYYELNVSYAGGFRTDDIFVTFDPYLNYTFSPMFDGTLFSTIIGASTRGKDDTLNFSCILTFEGLPKVGETVSLYDVTSGETLIDSDVTDVDGYYEFLLTLNDGTYLASHDYEIRTDFLTNETTIVFDPELYYSFTARLDDIPFISTASADTRIKTTGQSVEISLSLLHNSVGESGAIVTLTDLTTGMVLNTSTTDGSGYYNFTINYGAGVNPGPHKYHISLYYDGIYFTLSGVDYENNIWVIYNNALDCQTIRPDWNEVLGIGDTLQTIELTGTLYDTNSLGYNYAELTYWILQGGSVIDHTGIFSVSLSWVTNSRVGTFTAYISLIGAIEPSIGNYSIIIGFDGTLNFTDTGLTYNAVSQSNNATGLDFTIYDKPYLDTSYEYDTEGFGFIVGGTNFNITGTLYYSNGTAIAIAGQTITIRFYDDNEQILDTQTVFTDASGNYVLNDFLMAWDISYYTVSYSGDDAESLDAANLLTEPLIE